MRPADVTTPILRDRMRARMRTAGVLAVATTVTAAVACAAFALTAHGLFGFARARMHLPAELAWVVPVAVDLGSVCAIVAAYALRNARMRVRIYTWCVFAVTVALSVAGNEAFAVARRLPLDGRVGAAAPPLLLAITVHLLIMVRRDTDRVRAARARAAQPTHPERKITDANRPGKRGADDRRPGVHSPVDSPVDDQTQQGAGRRPNQLDPRAPLAAARVIKGGQSAASVAESIATPQAPASKRAVQRWVQLARLGQLELPDLDQTLTKVALVTHPPSGNGHRPAPATPDGSTHDVT